MTPIRGDTAPVIRSLAVPPHEEVGEPVGVLAREALRRSQHLLHEGPPLRGLDERVELADQALAEPVGVGTGCEEAARLATDEVQADAGAVGDARHREADVGMILYRLI